MKYIKGNVIFPERLLKEIQKYVQGEMVYIPKPEGERCNWGERSGYKEALSLRNEKIRQHFRNGMSFEELSQKYYLSCESIRKIVYTKQ